MDWIQFLQLICLPAFAYMIYKISDLKKDVEILRMELSSFKVECAKSYATNDAINRIESKLDDIRNLVIQELKNK